jgi:hypothetical protein
MLDEKVGVSGEDVDTMLSDYLERSHLNWLAWIHQIKLKQYNSAAHALSSVAASETDMLRKRVSRAICLHVRQP